MFFSHANVVRITSTIWAVKIFATSFGSIEKVIIDALPFVRKARIVGASVLGIQVEMPPGIAGAVVVLVCLLPSRLFAKAHDITLCVPEQLEAAFRGALEEHAGLVGRQEPAVGHPPRIRAPRSGVGVFDVVVPPPELARRCAAEGAIGGLDGTVFR